MTAQRRLFSCLLLLAVMSLPLSADISVTLGGQYCGTSPIAGLCTSYIGANTITFDGLAASSPSSPLTAGIATYSWGAPGTPFVKGSASGEYAAPGANSGDSNKQDQTDYLTVGSPNRPNTVDIHFSIPIGYFGFYMGSPDSYNSIQFTFFDSNGASKTYTGSQLIPPGNQSWAVGEYVNFQVNPGDAKVTDIRLSSTQAAFETDNHAYSIPDGGSTASLLGLAFTVVGLVSRRMK